MQGLKKSALFIFVGSLNLLHGMLHLFQFIQSILLVSTSLSDHQEENMLNQILHSPYLAFVWAIVGILTLWIGVKDFIDHEKIISDTNLG